MANASEPALTSGMYTGHNCHIKLYKLQSDNIKCVWDVGKQPSSTAGECANWYDHLGVQCGNTE